MTPNGTHMGSTKQVRPKHERYDMTQNTPKTYTLETLTDILRSKGYDVIPGKQLKGRSDSVYVYVGMGSYYRFTRHEDGTIYHHAPIWNPFGAGIDSTISATGILLHDVEREVK